MRQEGQHAHVSDEEGLRPMEGSRSYRLDRDLFAAPGSWIHRPMGAADVTFPDGRCVAYGCDAGRLRERVEGRR